MMKVLLDLNSLVTPHLTGIGIYEQQLIRELKMHEDLDLLGALKLSRTLKRRTVLRHSHIPVVVEELALLLARSSWIYHGLDFRIPKSQRLKKVITVHDLVTFRQNLVDPRFKAEGQNELREMLVRRKPDWVVVNSEFTKNELTEFFPHLQDRVTVTHLGCDHVPRETTLQEEGRSSPSFPYFLFVGTLEIRKNLPRIMEAFLAFRQKHSDFKLILVGNSGHGFDQFQDLLLANPEAFVRPGYLSNEKVRDLYRGALALFFPSLYEGFGIPVLEAMRLGCPVITSDCGAMKEVAGSAAELVNPERVEQMVQALETLAFQKSRRMALIDLGRKQAQNFTWERTARLTRDVYYKLS